MEGKKIFKEYLFMVVGSFLMALCTKCIFDPAGMVMGGFNGIAIVVRHLTEDIVVGGIPLWLTTGVLNIPLFIIAWKILGFAFIRKTMITTVLVTVWLYIIPADLFGLTDNFLVCVFGAIVSGLSVGIVYTVGASTGGTDTLAALLQFFRRDISAVRFLQMVDGIIVIGSGVVFGLEKTLYALVSIYIAAKVSEMLLEGVNYATKVYIISDELEDIAQKIMKDLGRGVTLIQSKGAYTRQEKKMALCIISKRQIVAVKDIVREIDEDAFMIVSDVREVLGNGFLR